MSSAGAADSAAAAVRRVTAPAAPDAIPSARRAERDGTFYLPDFCAPRMVFAVVLISALVALTLALARPSGLGFLSELARVSLFVVWVGLTSAALLCYARRFLARLPIAAAAAAIFALLLANALALSAAAVALGRMLGAAGPGLALFPDEYGPFMLRNAGICLIVAAAALRYFFVSHQWRHHVRAEARSRLDALQARIRPHFLFNGLNTIASLTRTDPARAEAAVEDLADLFRATLKSAEHPLTLAEELELARLYERIEAQRLGDRLCVEWDVAELPATLKVPGLVIQPLLENAIYHGVESLDEGGVVRVSGRLEGDLVTIRVTNPCAEPAVGATREGNRLALDNIRERLRLAYGSRGRLDVARAAGHFDVTLRFPRLP